MSKSLYAVVALDEATDDSPRKLDLRLVRLDEREARELDEAIDEAEDFVLADEASIERGRTVDVWMVRLPDERPGTLLDALGLVRGLMSG